VVHRCVSTVFFQRQYPLDGVLAEAVSHSTRQYVSLPAFSGLPALESYIEKLGPWPSALMKAALPSQIPEDFGQVEAAGKWCSHFVPESREAGWPRLTGYTSERENQAATANLSY